MAAEFSASYLDTRTVRETAALSRMASVEAQLVLGSTYCAVAETELHFGHVTRALLAIQKVRHLGVAIRHRLEEPSYLPSACVGEFRDRLSQLEQRVIKTALRLKKKL